MEKKLRILLALCLWIGVCVLAKIVARLGADSAVSFVRTHHGQPSALVVEIGSAIVLIAASAYLILRAIKMCRTLDDKDGQKAPRPEKS